MFCSQFDTNLTPVPCTVEGKPFPFKDGPHEDRVL